MKPEVRKRPRDPSSAVASSHTEPPTKKARISDTSVSFTQYAIDHWRQSGSWPEEYFKPTSMSQDSMPAPSLRRKRSDIASQASTSTPSDQRTKEDSTPYNDVRYEELLRTKGVIMAQVTSDEEAPKAQSQQEIQTLLETDQPVPQNTGFQDKSYIKLFNCIHTKNEARIVQDIARLVVPSAETFYILGDESLVCLSESVNEGWNRTVPFVGTRPQPDYAVGFKQDAFTVEQIEKLAPHVPGGIMGSKRSYFLATSMMYFPFLASEVKCGAGGLDVADRQNAHSMAHAVRAIVELFRQTNRSGELSGEILAFSISHDARTVRIYGHYPIMPSKRTPKSDVSYYRYLIDSFDLRIHNGRNRWSTYKFVTNVYKLWVPKHLARLRSAIDDLPHPDQPRCASVDGTQELESSSQMPLNKPESFTTMDSLANDHLGTRGAEPLTPDTATSDLRPSKRHKA